MHRVGWVELSCGVLKTRCVNNSPYGKSNPVVFIPIAVEYPSLRPKMGNAAKSSTYCTQRIQ